MQMVIHYYYLYHLCDIVFLSINHMFSTSKRVLQMLLYILTAGGSQSPLDKKTFQERQEWLMRKFFEKITNDKLLELSHGDIHSPVCDSEDMDNWDGIGSNSGTITCIEYKMVVAGNFQLEYVPQTVVELELKWCRQVIPYLETRYFPARAISISLASNEISGDIHLDTLPLMLEALNLHMNQISGPISFLHLPPRIRTIDLSNNSISQKVIYFANVPASLSSVNLSFNSNIGKVRAVDENDEPKHRSKFQGWTLKEHDMISL